MHEIYELNIETKKKKLIDITEKKKKTHKS